MTRPLDKRAGCADPYDVETSDDGKPSFHLSPVILEVCSTRKPFV